MSERRRPHRGGKGGQEPRAVVEERIQRVWELSAAGRSQREIGREVNVSQAAVSKILQREADRLVAGRREEAERHRVRALAREEYIYGASMRAHERSRGDLTRRRQRQTLDKNGQVIHTIVEADVIPRDGDPRHLEQAERSLERMTKLHGLGHHGRTRSTAERDPSTARDRLASKLARLAMPRPPAADEPD